MGAPVLVYAGYRGTGVQYTKCVQGTRTGNTRSNSHREPFFGFWNTHTRLFLRRGPAKILIYKTGGAALEMLGLRGARRLDARATGGLCRGLAPMDALTPRELDHLALHQAGRLAVPPGTGCQAQLPEASASRFAVHGVHRRKLWRI